MASLGKINKSLSFQGKDAFQFALGSPGHSQCPRIIIKRVTFHSEIYPRLNNLYIQPGHGL